MKFQKRYLSLLVASAVLSPLSQSVLAAERASLEEIIVTAQRKSESLQDVPIAINAIAGNKLENMGVTDTVSLEQAIPGLTFVTTGPSATPFLRGIGSNAANPNDEPSVATYVDGVYIASPSANIIDLNNIERVEVLKGPQGTLFGRNATGGVVQIITRDPSSEPVLEVSAGVANYQTTTGSVYASTGITENLAVDIAIKGEAQDEGWGKSLVTGKDIRENSKSSVRTKLVYTPNDQLTVKLAGDYSELDTSMLIYTMPPGTIGIDGVPAPNNEYDSRSFITYKNIGTPGVIVRSNGGSLNVAYETDALRFVSISAYRDTSNNYRPEADTTPLPVVEGDLPASQTNISQEFQVMSNGESWFDWVAGVYIYRNRAGYDGVEFSGLAFANPPFSGIGFFSTKSFQDTDSESAYIQGTAKIAADTNLTLGARFTQEEQSFDRTLFGMALPKPSDKGFDEWTWRFALDHRFADDILGYISYNRGVKGGGFDLLDPFSAGFDPEQLDAYEIGFKTELLDNTLRLNASYFYYDFQNIQVQIIDAGVAGGSAVTTTNAAGATIHGLDVDFQYLATDNLSIYGGFAFINGEYDDFKNTVTYNASPLDPTVPAGATVTSSGQFIIDASGNETIRTPEFTGNVTAEYRVQSDMGVFPITLTVSHNSGFFFGADERLEQDAYTLVNATVGWQSPDEMYSLTLWGRNLTDEVYWTQGVPSGLGDLVSPAAPRTYGLTFSAKFGG